MEINGKLTFLSQFFCSFIIELLLDYILRIDFRNTALVGPCISFYYVGLWGLICYAFRVDEKWGFLTFATYFLNMVISVLQYFA